MTHELKILPKWFEDVTSGEKNFEIRRADRDFKVGDTLVLKEYEKGRYTGREIERTIQYIYKGDGTYGVSDEFWILGLKTIEGENKMKARTKEEIKAYVDGYNACYEQFCKELLKKRAGVNTAINKMEVMKVAVNSVLLTEEKTNGDMIKELFPSIELEHIDDIINVYSLCDHSVTFDTDWWNSPYVKGETE